MRSDGPDGELGLADGALYPTCAAVMNFLEAAGDLVPAISTDPRSSEDFPDEVRELMASHPSIKAMHVDTDGAVRHILPPKESGITWEMLTHRVMIDRDTEEVLDICFAMFGQPEDGNKNYFINTLHTPVDIRTWFLWSPDMADPAKLQSEFIPGGPVPEAGNAEGVRANPNTPDADPAQASVGGPAECHTGNEEEPRSG